MLTKPNTMKQQTAVEWLKEQIEELINAGIPQHIIEQAKELEKQQIMNAWHDGALDTNAYMDFAQQYYNEKFSK